MTVLSRNGSHPIANNRIELVYSNDENHLWRATLAVVRKTEHQHEHKYFIKICTDKLHYTRSEAFLQLKHDVRVDLDNLLQNKHQIRTSVLLPIQPLIQEGSLRPSASSKHTSEEVLSEAPTAPEPVKVRDGQKSTRNSVASRSLLPPETVPDDVPLDKFVQHQRSMRSLRNENASPMPTPGYMSRSRSYHDTSYRTPGRQYPQHPSDVARKYDARFTRKKESRQQRNWRDWYESLRELNTNSNNLGFELANEMDKVPPALPEPAGQVSRTASRYNNKQVPSVRYFDPMDPRNNIAHRRPTHQRSMPVLQPQRVNTPVAGPAPPDPERPQRRLEPQDWRSREAPSRYRHRGGSSKPVQQQPLRQSALVPPLPQEQRTAQEAPVPHSFSAPSSIRGEETGEPSRPRMKRERSVHFDKELKQKEEPQLEERSVTPSIRRKKSGKTPFPFRGTDQTVTLEQAESIDIDKQGAAKKVQAKPSKSCLRNRAQQETREQTQQQTPREQEQAPQQPIQDDFPEPTQDSPQVEREQPVEEYPYIPSPSVWKTPRGAMPEC